MTIPLGCALPLRTSLRPTRAAIRKTIQAFRPCAAPIRSCSRWGLPCRPCCQGRGALLPHPFTLAPGRPGAVCFLWHFPWGRPRRALPGTVFPWSPDFPPLAPFRDLRQRSSGRLAFRPCLYGPSGALGPVGPDRKSPPQCSLPQKGGGSGRGLSGPPLDRQRPVNPHPSLRADLPLSGGGAAPRRCGAGG